MQNKIEKIIVTGQALKRNWSAFLWIYELFCYSIENSTGLKCYCTIPYNKTDQYEDERYIPYDIKRIYNAYGIEFEYEELSEKIVDKWTKIYFNKEYNKEAYDYFYSIYKNSIVISFEIDKVVENALNYFNIPHIDINFDPIRFLPDVMLCFKTKIRKVYEKFLQYRVDEEFIYMNANYIKAIYNQHERPIGKNLLFLGQTDNDKTLIDLSRNEIYRITQHREEFEKEIKGFDKIIYKPHPFACQKLEKETIDYLKTLNNFQITDNNFYELCSRNDIKKVLAISSGTCQEARYFGKETKTLLREGVLRQTEDKFDSEKYVSIYGDFFSLNFWSDILSPLINTKKYNKVISINGENRLRNSRPHKLLYYSYKNLNTNAIETKIDKIQENTNKIKENTNKKLDEKVKEIENKVTKTIVAYKISES